MVSGSATVERFRPLFQPGNSSWEEMWRAKAGFVPSTSGPASRGRWTAGHAQAKSPAPVKPDQAPPA